MSSEPMFYRFGSSNPSRLDQLVAPLRKVAGCRGRAHLVSGNYHAWDHFRQRVAHVRPFAQFEANREWGSSGPSKNVLGTSNSFRKNSLLGIFCGFETSLAYLVAHFCSGVSNLLCLFAHSKGLSENEKRLLSSALSGFH